MTRWPSPTHLIQPPETYMCRAVLSLYCDVSFSFYFYFSLCLPVRIHPRKWLFGGWTGVVPVLVHGNGFLVDGPVFVPMLVHGSGLLVDGPVLCLCLSTEMAFWWIDRCSCLCLSTESAIWWMDRG